MSDPIADNHNDLFEVEISFEDITVAGLFINADAGVDSPQFTNLFQDKDIITNIYPNKRNRQNNQEN